MRATEILQLARTYAQATDLSLCSVGKRSTGNDKVFNRLAAGKGCSSRTLEKAESWFTKNWPDNLPWPDGVPRRANGEVTDGSRFSEILEGPAPRD